MDLIANIPTIKNISWLCALSCNLLYNHAIFHHTFLTVSCSVHFQQSLLKWHQAVTPNIKDYLTLPSFQNKRDTAALPF